MIGDEWMRLVRRNIMPAERFQFAKRRTRSRLRKHCRERSLRAGERPPARYRRDESFGPIACKPHSNARDDRIHNGVRGCVESNRWTAIPSAGKNACILRAGFISRTFRGEGGCANPAALACSAQET